MTIETTELVRTFRYNSVDLPDPGAQFTPEQVRDLFSNTYPEIVSAAIEGPEEKGGKLQYTFRRAVGTKGADPLQQDLIDAIAIRIDAGDRLSDIIELTDIPDLDDRSLRAAAVRLAGAVSDGIPLGGYDRDILLLAKHVLATCDKA